MPKTTPRSARLTLDQQEQLESVLEYMEMDYTSFLRLLIGVTYAKLQERKSDAGHSQADS